VNAVVEKFVLSGVVRWFICVVIARGREGYPRIKVPRLVIWKLGRNLRWWWLQLSSRRLLGI
jgi:hypothetical protein